MADTIKVQAMQKLAGVFGAMAAIGSVHRWQGSPTDLDRVKLPALFFWDEDEARDKRNRLAMGTLKLYVAVFIRLSPSGAAPFHDTADNLQGQLHNALIGTAGLKGLVENLQEDRVWKEFPNDQYGVLFMSFTLTYGHAWGDAFSTTY
jgi:hypothetical protein